MLQKINMALIQKVHTCHPQRVYNESFKNCEKFGIPYKIFVDKFPKIKERLNLWENRYSSEKKIFLTKYNIREWSYVNYEDKSKHALFECSECMADKNCVKHSQ